MPIIQATSPKVSIRDGKIFMPNYWSLAPEAKPDIYEVNRSKKNKWVTFYTDIDSFRVKVKPHKKYDFVIVWNGKDSCFTQIQGTQKVENKGVTTSDTLPFMLTANNNMYFKALINGKDSLNIMFDTGATGMPITMDAVLHKTTTLVRDSTVKQYQRLPVNTLHIGKMTWNNLNAFVNILSGRGTDGHIGWDLFDGKVVEIDYDKKIMIVRSSLPKIPKSYAKYEMTFINGLFYIEGFLAKKDAKKKQYFLFDSGFDRAMMLDSSWQNVSTDWHFLSKTAYRDAAGNAFESKTYRCPKLELGKISLSDIPAKQMTGENHAFPNVHILGNELLKRFNTILDFQHDCLYLSPNSLMNLPYNEAS